MNFRCLTTLVAIADHGSFAAAGGAVGITQSAVSLQIKALERELRMPLFDRSRRPPVLNERGIALVARAREIMQLCHNLRESAHSDSYSGVLKLGAVPTVLSGVLPAALSQMNKMHPDLLIIVSSGLSDVLGKQVFCGNLDGAICSEPPQKTSGLCWQPFAAEDLVVIMPTSGSCETDREALNSFPYIRFKASAWAGQLIDVQLSDLGVDVRSRMEIDSLEAINQMVAHGLGVSVVPLRVAAPPLPKGVKVLPFGKRPVKRVVVTLERSINPKAHFIKTLNNILCEICKDHKA